MANGERSREAVHYHDNGYNYMHNHVLTPQHLMPVGEEDDDGAILMLHGAQGSKYHHLSPLNPLISSIIIQILLIGLHTFFIEC